MHAHKADKAHSHAQLTNLAPSIVGFFLDVHRRQILIVVYTQRHSNHGTHPLKHVLPLQDKFVGSVTQRYIKNMKGCSINVTHPHKHVFLLLHAKRAGNVKTWCNLQQVV
jgi:hypothetical protein